MQCSSFHISDKLYQSKLKNEIFVESTHFVETQVEDFVADSNQIISDFKTRVHKLLEILVGHDVPDAVAGQHNKLVLLIWTFPSIHLGLGRDKLLAGAPILHAFVLEIAESAGHGQRAVDPLNHDRTARVMYSLPLGRVYGLVVIGAQHDLVVAAHKRSRVAAVDQIAVSGADEAGDRRGAALVLASLKLGQTANLIVQVQEAFAYGGLQAILKFLSEANTRLDRQDAF